MRLIARDRRESG